MEIFELAERSQFYGLLCLAYVGAVSMFVLCGAELAAGLLTGGRFEKFRIWWLEIKKEEGRLCFRKAPFTILPHCAMGGRLNTDLRARRIYEIWSGALSVAVLTCVVGVLIWFRRFSKLDDLLVFGMLIMTGCVLVLHLATLVRVIRMPHNTSLTGVCWNTAQKVEACLYEGHRISEYSSLLQIDIPQNDLEGNLILMPYILYQYYLALERRDVPAVREAVGKISCVLGKGFRDASHEIFYGELLFYYSFFDWNEEYAKIYWRACGVDFEKETAVNWLRIYAYYLYNIRGDKQKALETIDRGLHGIRNYEPRGLALLEQELLLFLREIIYQERE